MSPSLAVALALTALILLPLGYLEYKVFEIGPNEEEDIGGFTPIAGCFFGFIGIILLGINWLIYFIIN